MARLRGCGHVPLRRDCGLGHRAARFAAIYNRRPRQLDLGRHGRVRRRIPRADYRRGRDRTSLGACDHRHGAQYRPHWSGAAYPWRFSCRPGDTFCSLSGGRRLPRGDRMAHRHGRGASGDGSASHVGDRGRAFRRVDRRKAAGWRAAGHRTFSRPALAASPFALPGLLLTGVIAAHLALLAFGVTLDQAQAEGWMFAPQLQVGLMSPWHSDMLVRFPWHALPSLFGDLLSVMFVAAITMLLHTSAVELATQREANLDRELKSHGIANLLIAAVGGYIGVTSVSRTVVNYLAGATSSLSAITVAWVSAAGVVVNPNFLGYVPKCVLGGLLFYLG